MYMVEKLDVGDMILKVEVDIEEIDNVGMLYDKLSVVGVKLLFEMVLNVIVGSILFEK